MWDNILFTLGLFLVKISEHCNIPKNFNIIILKTLLMSICCFNLTALYDLNSTLACIIPRACYYMFDLDCQSKSLLLGDIADYEFKVLVNLT